MTENIINYDFTDKTILIVEDDTVSRLYLRELLAPTGALVEFVRTGHEVFEYFKTRIPHLILMDIKLPDIDGITVSNSLLKDFPTLKIVAQTAFANEDIKRQCMDIGMKAFLTKPLRNDDLMAVLVQLL